MVYKSFSFRLVLRVGLLFLLLCLEAYLLNIAGYGLSKFALGIVILLSLAELIYYINKTNRQMSMFLEAMAHDDLSHRPREKEGGSSWKALYRAYRLIHDKMFQLQTGKEEKHHFLQLLTDKAGVGLMTFDDFGHVILFNEEAKKLLGVPHVSTLDMLNKHVTGLGDKFKQLKPEEKCLIRLAHDNSLLQIKVHTTHFRQSEKHFTLLSFQHIGAELDEQEIAAWQKLISVLTHEVMNSITPIISLASTARQLLASQSVPATATEADKDNEWMTDLQDALRTIETRSKGMLNFVEAYRRLNRVRVPELQPVSLESYFERIRQLMEPELSRQGIKLKINTPARTSIFADPEQLEQVFINLINNAQAAVEGQDFSEINIQVQEEEPYVFITLSDSGKGIPADIHDKIFIPFFSTKASGSGVGLSICKQIMRSHGGDIQLLAENKGGAAFRLRFNAA